MEMMWMGKILGTATKERVYIPSLTVNDLANNSSPRAGARSLAQCCQARGRELVEPDTGAHDQRRVDDTSKSAVWHPTSPHGSTFAAFWTDETTAALVGARVEGRSWCTLRRATAQLSMVSSQLGLADCARARLPRFDE
jgi:hypothetical protein